jgi:hypothetical protein
MLYISSKDFKLRARTVFLFICSLTIVWVYLALSRIKANIHPIVLITGPLILGFSEEALYHARWLAPDGLLMQSSALTILLSIYCVRNERKRISLFILAAIAGGLCAGIKYQGGLFILPVVLALYTKSDKACSMRFIIESAILLAVFAATFLVTTPAALLDTDRFIDDVTSEIVHYRSGEHWGYTGYTVASFVEHLGLMTAYVSLVLLSKSTLASVTFFALAMAGMFHLAANDRKTAFVLLPVPIIYFFYFSTQRVMIVRNLLCLLPFLSIFSALGVQHFLKFKRRAGSVVAGIVMMLLAVSAAIPIISPVTPKASDAKCKETVDRHIDNSEETFYATPSIALQRSSSFLMAKSPQKAERFVFSTTEVNHTKLEANRPYTYEVLCGTEEVNFNYYPTWIGETFVVSMDMGKAINMGIVK